MIPTHVNVAWHRLRSARERHASQGDPRARAAWLAVALTLALAGAARIAAQPAPHEPLSATLAPAAADAHRAAAAEGEHGQETHEAGFLPVVARLVNFAILAGTLIYLLRSPAGRYLSGRGAAIRAELAATRDTRRVAQLEFAEAEHRLAALPGEIAALRARGAREIAAEEERLRHASQAECERVLEQTRRAIERQVRTARRELVQHAATLSVGLAAERIKLAVTDDDQRRLMDRYLDQLEKGRAAGVGL